MTVETTTNTTVSLTNGATVTFPFYFYLIDESHLSVTLRNLTTGAETSVASSAYTVSGLGNSTGGSITFGVAPDDGYQLIIQRIVPYKQNADLLNQSGFYPESIEDQLDLTVMQIQQIAYQVGLAITAAPGDTPFVFPTVEIRKSKYVSFDAAGDLYMSAGTGADTGLRTDLATNGGPLVVLNDGETIQAAVNVASNPVALLASINALPEGAFVRTGDGYIYQVAASSATDHHITTAGGVKLYVIPVDGRYHAPAFGVTNEIEYQAMLDVVPEGANVYNPPGWSVDLEDGLTIDTQIILSGAGLLNFTAGIAGKAAIQVNADGTDIKGIKAINENLLGNETSGSDRPYCIEIQAHDVSVSGCTLIQFQNPIAQRANGEWYRSKIENNFCLECLGAGGGQASASINGEDRGDGITIWGAGSIVSGNIVTLKSGEDGRIGIHAERLSGSIVTSGPYDDTAVSVIGNHVYGAWRRGIAFEGMRGATAVGNTVVGPTWWALAIVKGCVSCSMTDNTVYWTQPNTSWGSWSPTIAPLEFGFDLTDCHMDHNTVYMAAGSKCAVGLSMQNDPNGFQTDCSMNFNDLLCEDDTVVFSIALARIQSASGIYAIRPQMKGNTVKGKAPQGILAQRCEDPVIDDNIVISYASSPDTGARGVSFSDASTTHISSRRNYLEGWETGVLVASVTTSGIVDDNFIKDCTTGISTGSSMSGVTITRNRFSGVTTRISGVPQSQRHLCYDNEGQRLYYEATFDPVDIASGASASSNFTVTGAALGDFVEIAREADRAGLMWTGFVSAADTVTVVQGNLTGGNVNLSSVDIRILVRKIGAYT